MTPITDEYARLREDLGNLKLEVAGLRGDLREGISEVKGAVTAVQGGADHVRREMEQSISFHGDLIKQLTEELNLLRTLQQEYRDKAALDTSSVRVALETQIDLLENDVSGRVGKVTVDLRADLEALKVRTTALETHNARFEGSTKVAAVVGRAAWAVCASILTALVIYAITHQ